MRFLLDENLSPLVAEHLASAGFEAVHVRDVGLQRAGDQVIMARAANDGSVLVSADTDFGQLLAIGGATRPSVILLRREADRRAASQAALIIANIAQVVHDLDEGAIVVLEPERVRVRRLPL